MEWFQELLKRIDWELVVMWALALMFPVSLVIVAVMDLMSS